MPSVPDLEAVHDRRAREDEPPRTPHPVEAFGGLGLMVLYFVPFVEDAVILEWDWM